MPVVEEPLRILAWNVHHKINRRPMPPSYSNGILSFEPDVVVLTEYVEGPDHAPFCSALRKGGLAYQCHTKFERRHNHVFSDGFVRPDYSPDFASRLCFLLF
jgi:hypothetical protein